jgi:uncharacterized protein involved in exopolysaccharide biosynthesis
MSTEISPQNDEISLKELIQKIGDWYRYLKTQWWKITIAGFIGGIIGFVYAWMQPITYTAKITFVVEEGKSGASSLGGLASLAGQFGVDMGGAVSSSGLLSGENIFLYLKSESLAREVLLSRYDKSSTKSLADNYAEVYELKKSWVKNEKIGKVSFSVLDSKITYTRLQDSLLKKIIENILKTQFAVAKTDKKASFIEVSASMENEILAKEYCERLVRVAVERYIKVKTLRQKNSVDNLQSRVDSIAYLLSKKTASSAALQTSASTMDINPLYKTGAAIATETTFRDKAMLSTIFASVTQNLEMAKFTLSQETPVIQIVDQPIFPLITNKVSRLKNTITISLIFSLLIVIVLIVKKVIKDIA